MARKTLILGGKHFRKDNWHNWEVEQTSPDTWWKQWEEKGEKYQTLAPRSTLKRLFLGFNPVWVLRTADAWNAKLASSRPSEGRPKTQRNGARGDRAGVRDISPQSLLPARTRDIIIRLIRTRFVPQAVGEAQRRVASVVLRRKVCAVL